MVMDDYDAGNGPEACVHTFRDSAIGLLGAHWSIVDARTAFETFGAEEAGPAATAMGHGVVVTDKTSAVFFETKERD